MSGMFLRVFVFNSDMLCFFFRSRPFGKAVRTSWRDDGCPTTPQLRTSDARHGLWLQC